MLSLFLIYMLKFLFKKNTINGKLSNFVILTKVILSYVHAWRERERERERGTIKVNRMDHLSCIIILLFINQ